MGLLISIKTQVVDFTPAIPSEKGAGYWGGAPSVLMAAWARPFPRLADGSIVRLAPGSSQT